MNNTTQQAWTELMIHGLSKTFVKMTRNGFVPVSTINNKVEEAINYAIGVERMRFDEITKQLLAKHDELEKLITSLKKPSWWEIWKEGKFQRDLTILIAAKEATYDCLRIIYSVQPIASELPEPPIQPNQQTAKTTDSSQVVMPAP